MYMHMQFLARDAFKLVRRISPHRLRVACARARNGPCKGLPKPGPGEDQGAGTEVPPPWGARRR